MVDSGSSRQKVTFEEFKNILSQELDYLGIPKKEWNQYLRDLLRDSSNDTVKTEDIKE